MEGRAAKKRRGGSPSYLRGKSAGLAAATDTVLVVAGKEFPVHTAVLAAGCKFFDNLFFDSPRGPAGGSTAPTGEGAGGGGGGSGERRVVLAGAGAAVGPSPLTQESLELFLNHLYGGPSVKLATAEEAGELLLAADFFAEDCCLRKCKCDFLAEPDRLRQAIKPGNGTFNKEVLLRHVNLASRYRLRALMVCCLPYLVDGVFAGSCAGSQLLEEAPLDATALKAVVAGVSEQLLKQGTSNRSYFAVECSFEATNPEAYLSYLEQRSWGH